MKTILNRRIAAILASVVLAATFATTVSASSTPMTTEVESYRMLDSHDSMSYRADKIKTIFDFRTSRAYGLGGDLCHGDYVEAEGFAGVYVDTA